MEDYLAFHSWIDYTKGQLADCRHRMLLHNSWGIFVIERKFGPVFPRASDGEAMPTRTLAERHIIEDLKCIPTLARCLEQFAPEHDVRTPDVYAQSCHSAALFGGRWQDYALVHHFMDWPRQHVPDGRHRRVLCNSWGIALACDMLGETLTRHDGTIISIQQIAEAHVRHALGTIPSLEESLTDFVLQPWMCRGAAPLSRLFATAD